MTEGLDIQHSPAHHCRRGFSQDNTLFVEGDPVNVGAVSRASIPDEHTVVGQFDGAMFPGRAVGG